MEDEEAFSFIRSEDEPGYFLWPTERHMSHLRPLHITNTLSGIKVNKVLIDGGAAISLLPERMLMKVGKHLDDLVPINIAVTDFSGTSTPAKGWVTLTVKVGSSERNTVFVVVPSKASYNALLGLLPVFGRPLNKVVLPRFGVCSNWLGLSDLKISQRLPYGPENKDGSSDEVESHRVSTLSKYDNIDSTSSVEFSYNFTASYNESNDASRTADLIAEAHCVENRSNDNELNDSVLSISNDTIDFTFDCIYDLEPLGFEKYLQTPRRFAPEINEKIKEEIERLVKAKFIRTARYVEWVSNIVPVMKKNGKLRVCIDFRDLNNATPKDE
ncbi:uncharacterized protein [Arachis hypogaea]|uniref:uncharacterized protein n=1 Tax=Arachis hypogaea TaxID=3818 RepID=UPI000DEC0981|nr:uncharacterized protein LOC112747004 [Arachis hypogaea]XP_025697687.1 uncharacterized protein LOC112799912 [Arachis hypogaea]